MDDYINILEGLLEEDSAPVAEPLPPRNACGASSRNTREASPPPPHQEAAPPPPSAAYAGAGQAVPPIIVNVGGGERKSLLGRIASSMALSWIIRIFISLIFFGIPTWLPYILAGALGLMGWKVAAPDGIKQAAHHVVERVEDAVDHVKEKVGDAVDRVKERAAERAEKAKERVEAARERAKAVGATASSVASLVPAHQPSPSIFSRVTGPSANGACWYCNETAYIPPELVDQAVRCGRCYSSHDLGEYMITHFQSLDYPDGGGDSPPPTNKKVGVILSPLGKKKRPPPVKEAPVYDDSPRYRVPPPGQRSPYYFGPERTYYGR